MEIDSDVEEKKRNASVLKKKASIDILSETRCCLRMNSAASQRLDTEIIDVDAITLEERKEYYTKLGQKSTQDNAGDQYKADDALKAYMNKKKKENATKDRKTDSLC